MADWIVTNGAMKPADGSRRYGASAGHPAGNPEDQKRCIEEVSGPEAWDRGHQCSRKRGFGPDGLYCKQHAPTAVETRRKAAQDAWNAKSASMRRSGKARELRHNISELARKVFKQDASFDDLESAVAELEALLAESFAGGPHLPQGQRER